MLRLSTNVLSLSLFICSHPVYGQSITAVSTTSTFTSGTLMAATKLSTTYSICRSATAGPVVMITGGVHGDEPAGSQAAQAIAGWTILRGTLIVAPRLNVPGLAAHTRHVPGLEPKLADLNRDFARVGRDETPRGPLAASIWQLVATQKPDWFIDLHEAHSLHDPMVNGGENDSVGNTLLCCKSALDTKLPPVLLTAVNGPISDARERFIISRPPKDGTLARAIGEHLHTPSLIVETAEPGQTVEVRVAEHCHVVRALLQELKMLDR